MSRLRALACVAFASAVAMIMVAVCPERVAAAPPCWERVIADWSDNGRVDRTYPLPCYRAAVKHLPEDLRAYSSAPAEIDRALAERRVAPPASARAVVGVHASHQDTGVRVAMLVPPLAGVLTAIGVGWWLVRARVRRPSRGR